jgi:hypothetical protein
VEVLAPTALRQRIAQIASRIVDSQQGWRGYFVKIISVFEIKTVNLWGTWDALSNSFLPGIACARPDGVQNDVILPFCGPRMEKWAF